MKITFLNNEVSLASKPIQVGDTLPSFLLKTNDLKSVTDQDIKQKTLFIVVPSIDTDVCDLEIQRFSKALEGVEGVKVYGVSMDLPFAQARWCGAKNASNVELVSDYMDHSFGLNTGTYVNELGLLTRAIIVVDAQRKVTYVEYCEEITNQPDYDKALEAVK